MFASLPTALIAAFVPVLARIHATHIIGLALKTFIIVAIVAVLILALLFYLLLRLMRGRGERR